MALFVPLGFPQTVRLFAGQKSEYRLVGIKYTMMHNELGSLVVLCSSSIYGRWCHEDLISFDPAEPVLTRYSRFYVSFLVLVRFYVSRFLSAEVARTPSYLSACGPIHNVPHSCHLTCGVLSRATVDAHWLGYYFRELESLPLTNQSHTFHVHHFVYDVPDLNAWWRCSFTPCTQLRLL